MGWLDQRAWGTTMALAALNTTAPPHPLLARAEAELAQLRPRRPTPGREPALRAVVAADWGKPRALLGGAATATFDGAGTIGAGRYCHFDRK